VEYSQIVGIIAPCGLNCGKCLAFEGGEIQVHAKALSGLLGDNFAKYADYLSRFNPVFENYASFSEFLDFLGRGSCGSCRQSGCLFSDCRVHACVEEKRVDFCFQCGEFPCRDNGLPERIYNIWRINNEKMRDMGVKEYYEKIKDRPRYP